MNGVLNGRMNGAAACFAACLGSIIGKVRGGRIPMLIVTTITAVLTFLFAAFDAYMLIYYIGMTY